MAIDPEIRRMMNVPVMWAPELGRNESGDPQHAIPVLSILARVEPREDVVRESADGEQVTYGVAILTETKLPEGAKVWLPGVPTLDKAHGRVVKSVATMNDEDGSVSHYEILV